MCDKSESPIHGSLVITIFLILILDRVTPLVINRSQPDFSVLRSWGLGPLRGHGADIKNRLILQENGSLRNRQDGQNDEKMWRDTVHSQSYATSFRHSAVLSVTAVLLHKLPITGTRKRKTATPAN